jgi:hypothetical protein
MPFLLLRSGIINLDVCRSGRDWPNLFDGTKRLKKSPTEALSKLLGAGLMPARSSFTQNGIKLVVTRTIMPFCHLRATAHHTPEVFVHAERQDVTAQADGG